MAGYGGARKKVAGSMAKRIQDFTPQEIQASRQRQLRQIKTHSDSLGILYKEEERRSPSTKPRTLLKAVRNRRVEA